MSKMPQFRTDGAFQSRLLKSNLDSFITITGSSLNLRYNTRTSFDHCDRDSCAVRPKYLGHADFSAQQSTEHILSSLLCCRNRFIAPSADLSALVTMPLLYSLISMSTPAGRFNRVRASTVLLVGSIISIRRLCVRISNWSRASLSINGERITVYLLISVGRGTGPETRAPVCCAVSTICIAD